MPRPRGVFNGGPRLFRSGCNSSFECRAGPERLGGIVLQYPHLESLTVGASNLEFPQSSFLWNVGVSNRHPANHSKAVWTPGL